MRYLILSILTLIGVLDSSAETKTIHAFVALCDNANQGIVPVPSSLGNGQDPKSNLYWGAAFGMKSYFRYKTTDWKFLKTIPSENPEILERVLFKHATRSIYLLADAYDGKHIKDCIEEFLYASNDQHVQTIQYEGSSLSFGVSASLVAYLGHNGLMDFDVSIAYEKRPSKTTDAIILACYSKPYFKQEIEAAQAELILGTTHLMAPEAYTFKAALDGWIREESNEQIVERAAQAYNKYQKCGIKGSRNLFSSGVQ